MPAQWGETTSAPAATQPSTGEPELMQLARWWQKFNDPMLDQLIQQAIRGNLTLRQAESRILQARAQRCIAASALWPTANLAANYSHFRSSPVGLGTGGPGSGTVNPGQGSSPGQIGGTGGGVGLEQNFYQVGFDASWEIDVFGGARRALQAADANLSTAIEDRRDVLVTLLAEVAVNYIELRGLQRQIVVAEENLQTQTRSLELTKVQFDAGTATALAVAQAQAQVANTQAQIPPLRTSVRQRIHLLGTLLGQDPMALSARLSEVNPIPTGPPEVPVGLPSGLLRQRADVRRSECQLAAASAEIGVAVAQLFPQFTLNGDIGRQGFTLSNLKSPASTFWSIGPSMSWTVFDAGHNCYTVEVQQALEQQARETYQQTVLTALQEVEDALVASAQEKDHYQALKDAVAANRRNLELAGQLYLEGRTDFLSVLVAQQSLYAAENSLVQSEQALATDVVSLYKALGGGWQ